MKRNTHKWGPGILVTAAFIGPGTLTVCTLAGVQSGTVLLWALLASVLITIFIQNIAIRISWITGKGLAEAVRTAVQNKVFKGILLGLILVAIFVGNAAYEAGNLSGAVLGLDVFVPIPKTAFFGVYVDWSPLLIGGVVAGLLWWGNLRFVKNILIGVVILMSVSFLIAAIITQPDLPALLKGLLLPKWHSKDELLLVVALLGTTVVPYNLFLHAALLKVERKAHSTLQQFQKDTVLAVGLGGLISLSIVVAASNTALTTVSSAVDLGVSLQSLYGNLAGFLSGIGLFAAGISSAITAPLAAGYVVSEVFDWQQQKQKQYSKIIALIVLGVGLVFSSLDVKPIEIIRLAQVANGLLLPLLGGFLLWFLIQKKWELGYKQIVRVRIGLILVILFFVFLAFRTIERIFF